MVAACGDEFSTVTVATMRASLLGTARESFWGRCLLPAPGALDETASNWSPTVDDAILFQWYAIVENVVKHIVKNMPYARCDKQLKLSKLHFKRHRLLMLFETLTQSDTNALTIDRPRHLQHKVIGLENNGYSVIKSD